MRILAVGAHPDDVEIFCGGTLARCSDRGDEVFMAYLCHGDKGSAEIDPGLAQVRHAEARAAGDLIGAEVFGGFFPDRELTTQREARDTVIDLLRSVQPDVIITHDPNDNGVDHQATSELVFAATDIAFVPPYKTRHATPVNGRPPVYYADTQGGFNFQPEVWVDVTDYMETKLAMLRCHKSQYRWFEGVLQSNMERVLRVVAEYRGIQANCPYAEAFRPLHMWMRGHVKRLLP